MQNTRHLSHSRAATDIIRRARTGAADRVAAVVVAATLAVTSLLWSVTSASAASPTTASPTTASPTGVASSHRAGATPVSGTYTAVPPSRILDTRTGFGGATVPPHGVLTVAVAGHGGVPPAGGPAGSPGTGPSAVNVNVTATNAGAPGYLTVYPTGSGVPLASNLNFTADHDVANTTVARLGISGSINIYNSSSKTVDLIVDVSGYYLTGLAGQVPAIVPGTYQPLTNQARLLDTRTLGPAATLGFGHFLSVTVAGVAGVPAGAGSVVLNVTAVNATSNGHLRVYTAGSGIPFASNLNFTANRTVANEVVVAPAVNNKVSIYNGAQRGSTDVVVDVIGYIAGGLLPSTLPGLQIAVTPFRLLDTRAAIGTPTVAKVLSGGRRTVVVAGVDGVPTSSVQAAVITVTATNEARTGYATVYPGGTLPTVSILNFLTNTDVANVMIAPVAPDGTITIYNGSLGATDLVIDISAYVTGATGAGN